MGNPAGPGKQYCTSCGELIDRESTFCTYCGAESKDRQFPTERSGPATASDSRSFRQSNKSDTAVRPRSQPHRQHGGTGEYTTEQVLGQDAPEPGTEKRDFRSPRLGIIPIGEPRWDEPRHRTVAVAGGLGVLGVVLLVIFSAIGGAILFGLQVPELAVFGLATAVGQYLGFMGLGFWYLRNRGFDWDRVWAYIGLRVPSLKEIGLVFLGWVTIIVLIVIVSIVAQFFLPEPAENEGAAMLAEGSDNMALYFGAVLFMFLVVGPCEELLYRGVVQNRLRERLPAVPAIVIASAIFAAVHVVALAGGDPAAMATTVGILFVPSIVLGGIYEYTGNIVVPSLLHGLHNSFIVTILFFGPELEESAEFINTVLALLPL